MISPLKLREVAGYHIGVDIPVRLEQFLQSNAVQVAALLEAADRIEQLEKELKECRKDPT